MQRPFCNLSAKDYGLKDHPDSFKAAKEINATILDVIDLQFMSYENKWLAIYQTLQKHKNLGAVNQQALDAIESVFFLNGIETMKSKAPNNALETKATDASAKDGRLFFAAVAGMIALAGCVLLVVG
jgi:hypothetical protein